MSDKGSLYEEMTFEQSSVTWRKSAPDRRYSKCKGPELGTRSAYSMNSKTMGVAGEEGVSGQVAENELR